MYAIQTPDNRIAALLRASVPAQSWQLATSQRFLSVGSASQYRPTRREFLIGAGSLLELAPFGCGGESGQGGETTSSNTRTVEHAGGTSKVSMRPDRVVTISIVVAAHLASVGLLPVAADSFAVEWLRPYKELLEELNESEVDLSTIQSIGTNEEPNLEKIASIGPELILAETYLDESLWDRLAEIAPTVIVFRGDLDEYGETEPSNAGWKQAFDQAVRAVGHQGGAEQVRQSYAEVVEEVRSEDSSATVTFLRANDSGNFRIDGSEGFGGSVAEEAGIPLSDLPSDGEEEGGYVSFSLERLADVVTGDVIVTTAQESGGPSSIEEIEQSSLWNSLPAVQAGRIIRLPQPIYNGGTYVATEILLRELQKELK